MEREQEKSVMINTWMVLLGDFDGDEFLKNSSAEVRKVYTRATRVENQEQLTHADRISQMRRTAAKKRWHNGYNSRKPVVKVNEHGEFITEYDSVTQAAKKNNMSADSVYKVCTGFHKKIKGCIFRYKKDFMASLEAVK